MLCCIIFIKCILKFFFLILSLCICSVLWLNVIYLFFLWFVDVWLLVLKNLKRGCKYEGRNYTVGYVFSRVNLKILF